MKVLTTRNVHQALPFGVRLLTHDGIQRDSRNGLVLQSPWPVTTVYERPEERVVFWAERDANPFFHLYEALWMIAGRNDLAPLLRYVKTFGQFSDDGQTLNGAYGQRWRSYFRGKDQLEVIIRRLRENPEDRRCVLGMWDTSYDLDNHSRDVPCNTTATFQVDPDGRLSLTVFCRSNDIVWGAYGANAVHFSMLLEYMAMRIGVPMGVYRQISVNFHGYLATLKSVLDLPRYIDPLVNGGSVADRDPYTVGRVVPTLLCDTERDQINSYIFRILAAANSQFCSDPEPKLHWPMWAQVFYRVLYAHEAYRSGSIAHAFDLLQPVMDYDWGHAAYLWLRRRVEGCMKQVSVG